MRVVNPGYDWKTHPYLYMADAYIESEEEVLRLAEEGYLEAYIDPARSPGITLPRPLTAIPRVASPAAAAVPQPAVSIREELAAAAAVHDEGTAYVRAIMRDLRAGKLNVEPAAMVMENILDSLERNADALLCLSRLRRNDAYTYLHCVNVCVLTAHFARSAGLSSDEAFTAGLAGLFHDLGKFLVPPTILNAPRKLTLAERNLMKTHPTLGHDQLGAVPGMADEVLMGALQHHEKHDGTGYPQGTAGEDISSIGRIVAVADVYDALTSKRAYKEGMPAHKALAIMYEMRDKDFQQGTLVRFIRMLGVYPVGSVVELEDNTKGVVSACNPAAPARPVVFLVRDQNGKPMPERSIDLAAQPEAPAVARCLAPEETDIDPALVLGIE